MFAEKLFYRILLSVKLRENWKNCRDMKDCNFEAFTEQGCSAQMYNIFNYFTLSNNGL